MTRSLSSQPDPVLVRDELRRLLQSTFIPEGSLLAKVLTYVVERTLDGDGKSIKAYTIAVEALGRGADFDPDRDSTVRVAAMRLRAALDLYYSGPGAENELRIRLVPGSYRPTFEAAEPADAPEVPLAPAHTTRLPFRLPSTRVWLATISAILALDLAMTVSLMAVQMRGSAAASAQVGSAPTQAEDKSAQLTAEKTSQLRAPGVYELVQRQVQSSYGQHP